MRPDVEIERFAARHAPSLTAGSWVMQTEHSAPARDRFRGMELTKTFAREAYSSALESWAWLDIATKVPVLATLFGDVFFQDAGGYWFLDTIRAASGRSPAPETSCRQSSTHRRVRTSTCSVVSPWRWTVTDYSFSLNRSTTSRFRRSLEERSSRPTSRSWTSSFRSTSPASCTTRYGTCHLGPKSKASRSTSSWPQPRSEPLQARRPSRTVCLERSPHRRVAQDRRKGHLLQLRGDLRV